MQEALEQLKSSAVCLIEKASGIDEIENLRVKYLGKKGELTTVLKELGKMPADVRPVMGQLANTIKNQLTELMDGKKSEIENKKLEDEILNQSLDITLPGKVPTPGRIHPITQILKEIRDIFTGLGFEVVDGPEVETEYNNFEALNIPADHPSREMWDSFYFRKGLLLRSHTSPVQVRVMKERKPPIKIIVPGKTYRRDTVDATHHWMFHQVEGLLVDENVTFADLKGVLLNFAQQMFGETRKISFKPSYFPFTEPSAEMSIDCFVCNGEGCRVCKQSGWIEILGSGMVHPNVLRSAGYDPEKYTGFAFGMGPDRIAMLKYGINDIRLFSDNDLRFLEQF